MPLPDGDVPWPPKDTERPMAHYDAWAAWYSGDPDQLASVYGGHNHGPYGQQPRPRPSTYRGGVVGTIAKWFWGAPPNAAQQPTRLHVPIAGDIAAVNADLLYGEPPTLAVEDKATQDRLDELMTAGGLHAALLEGAEIASAYGGVFLRVGWNRQVADHPLVDAIAPDCAAPEWTGQHLRAVTFWRILSEPDETMVVRHLERHEPEVVYHGLYHGSRDNLGTKQPLKSNPETEHLAERITTGAKRLAVEYLPNMRPNRVIRGTPLGRSDYSGVEHLMDALDEAWSSWMRDIRLGKGRLVVPDSFLQNRGRGQAAGFDVEQELYAPVNELQGAKDSLANMMQPVQFEIRVDEHSRTCAELTEQIVRGSGFSAQTFGESKDLAVTATEVQHRERRTYSTRGRKIQYQDPRVSSLAQTVLEIDKAQFASRVAPQRPTLDWPDGVQESPERIATTAELLQRARAASTQTLVQMVNPDWDDTEVQAEVKRIESAEQEALSRASSALVSGQGNEEETDGGSEQGRAGEGGQQGQGDARQGGQRRPVPSAKPR
ncbi:hypothetical protein GCM10023224_05160 [Streptomonospora halophila]|uniref:Phage portal protein, SPP1 Gp6-like n=1 Tax=Streptomonospora halophila TaxID=427369 RepID=A0ABP9G631_9ACTN